MLDVNPSLIRFWEKKFDILKPHKNKKGNRMFTPEDVENLKLIYHLSKEQKMKLDGVQKRLKANLTGEKKNAEVIEQLIRIKAILMEVRQELRLGEVILESSQETPETLETETSTAIHYNIYNIEKPAEEEIKGPAPEVMAGPEPAVDVAPEPARQPVAKPNAAQEAIAENVTETAPTAQTKAAKSAPKKEAKSEAQVMNIFEQTLF